MYLKLITIAMIAAAAPASSQTLLDQLLAKAMKPKPTTMQPGQPSAFAAPMAPAQLIRAVVVIGACATASDAWNAVNRYSMTPQTYHAPFSGELVPMGSLKYHDRRQCLDVLRLGGWSKPAANALTFRAYYIAAESREAKGQTFDWQKMDGQGRIRNIGSGLS